MNIMIINPANGRLTDYAPRELAEDARRIARQHKAKLEAYWVEVREGAGVRLIAQCKRADGWSENHAEAI